MVNPKAKGRTAELKARDELRKLTGLAWERTPGSGALGAQHKLKGDLYIPDSRNGYCVEVKHYADDHLTSKILVHKSPKFLEWWGQTIRQAQQVDKKPFLIFKYNRSKFFFATYADLLDFDIPRTGRYFVLGEEDSPWILIGVLEDVAELINWTV